MSSWSIYCDGKRLNLIFLHAGLGKVLAPTIFDADNVLQKFFRLRQVNAK